MRMRKAFIIFLFLLITIVGIYLFNGNRQEYYEIFYIYGNEIFVKEKEGDPNDWQATFTITEDSIIRDKKRGYLPFSELKVGQIIQVRTEEKSPFTLSNPPRRSAKEVIVIR